MRVITGIARGRKLKEPDDMSVRPTTDMVKEALFNIIQSDIEGRKVLDLFAGTGQIGIEALSRGASSATFVDESPASLKLVKENLKRTKLQNAIVVQSDALTFLQNREKYDIIFLDPPFEKHLINKVLLLIFEFDKLNENGIIVCESNSEEEMPVLSDPYVKLREYKYGRVKITLYVKSVGRQL